MYLKERNAIDDFDNENWQEELEINNKGELNTLTNMILIFKT